MTGTGMCEAGRDAGSPSAERARCRAHRAAGRSANDPMTVDAAVRHPRRERVALSKWESTAQTPQRDAAIAMLAATVMKSGQQAPVQTSSNGLPSTRADWQRLALARAPRPASTGTAPGAAGRGGAAGSGAAAVRPRDRPEPRAWRPQWTGWGGSVPAPAARVARAAPGPPAGAPAASETAGGAAAGAGGRGRGAAVVSVSAVRRACGARVAPRAAQDKTELGQRATGMLSASLGWSGNRAPHRQ
jgi:hypothetical protein